MSVLATVGAPFRAVEAARPRDASPHGARPDGWRDRRRLLDACLSALEDESEQGRRYVSSDAAAFVRQAMPGIRAGDVIREAIELVFREQERVARILHTGVIAPIVRDRQSLRPEEARALTDQIKAGIHTTTLLLLEAHSKRAWQVLGYPTWEEYVKREFSLSRSRSYQLLDHGRVLHVLMASAKLQSVPDISAYAAAQILPRLDEVAAAVERRVTPEMDERTVRRSIQSIVDDFRAPLTRVRDSMALTVVADPKKECFGTTERCTSRSKTARELAELTAIIEHSLQLPDAEEMFGRIEDDDLPLLSRLGDAATRLTAFADAWARHVGEYSCPEFLDNPKARHRRAQYEE
jgi:hypothetical protein